MDLERTLANIQIANSALQAGDTGSAKQHYDVILQDYPDIVPALFGRSVCHIRNENLHAALADIEQLLILQPNHVDSLTLLRNINATTQALEDLCRRANQVPIEQHLAAITTRGVAQRSSVPLTEGADPFWLFELRDAYLVGGHRLVMTSEGYLLEGQQRGMYSETYHAHQTTYYLENLPRYLKNSVRLSGLYCSLVSPWGCDNFYHWFTDMLPQVILAEESGFDGKYLVPHNMPFVDESLELIGIPEHRIVKHGATCLQVERLWLSDLTHAAQLERAPVLAYQIRERILRNYPEGMRTTAPNRILISRGSPQLKGKRFRLLVNEPELLEALAPFGFKRVDFEDYSLRDQIIISTRAQAIIGAHGAGLTHTLFMPPQSLFIEMFAPQFMNPMYFFPITRIMNHRYYSFVPVVLTDGKYEHGADILAPIELIKYTVARELGSN